MAYSAGDLSVELVGIDSGAMASVDNVSKSLRRLASALKSIQKTPTVEVGHRIENLFWRLSKATNSINTTNIEKLASASKSLASLTKIGKLQDLDYGKIGSGFENLTTAITPFIDKIKTAETSLVALYGTLSKASGKKMQNLLGDGNKPNSKNNGSFSFLNLAKWGAVIYSARRLGRVVATIAQKGADYTETLNLWETAMSGNLDLANKFVDKMNEAYGISKKTLMNAQATFKNMLGSLGQISESTAYALSEGITQMAIDYASLYNVNFEKAFEKFQAVLAGQVRPIRSVSGYDITENTLFEFYKQLGGTKSVRNLSRTEKQLLSILAIFNQMQASGAIGDLDKTINSFANQSRIMSEAWKEMTSYAGILLTHLLQESGILTYITAGLMFVSDFLRGVAESLGAIQSFGGDVFGDTTESIYGTIDALDELNGKLLDFDKFRALNEEEEGVGLDEKLREGFIRYETILNGASNSARELADSWLQMAGFMGEDGQLNISAINTDWQNFLSTLDSVLMVLTALVGAKMIAGIINFVEKIDLAKLGFALMWTGFTILLEGIKAFRDAWGDMGWGQRIITMLVAIGAAIIGVVIAMKALKLGVPAAIGLGAALAGAVLLTSSFIVENYEVPKFAEGGLPDKGTMFIAGEAGAEMVYNTPSGQSGVANIQQIAQANYNGTIKALNDWWGGMSAKQDIPKLQGANATGLYQAVTGVAKAQGEHWSKY